MEESLEIKIVDESKLSIYDNTNGKTIGNFSFGQTINLITGRIKIVKSNPIDYDVYLKFKIDGEEYWGVINNILKNPEVRSEVFKDDTLLQTKEWLIRTKGLILKNVKMWMKPQFGFFKSLKDEIHCYSGITGKLVILPLGAKIEVLKSYDDKIIFSYDSKQYTLTGDNFVYFNWWFEKLD
jgi:hypothetical protein